MMSDGQLNNILYVEDDPSMRMLVEMTLEDGGFNIEVAERCDEAVGIAQYYKPDLLLLDVVLPEKDGVETLIALRKLEGLENIPAIFLTVDVELSFPKNQDQADYQPYGILGKPIQVDTLCDRVRELWRGFQS